MNNHFTFHLAVGLVYFYFFWFGNLVVRAHTIKCGEVRCLGFEPDTCINYAMSLPTELSSRDNLDGLFQEDR